MNPKSAQCLKFANKKNNLSGAVMFKSERAELRRMFLYISVSCAPQIPAGCFHVNQIPPDQTSCKPQRIFSHSSPYANNR